MYAHAINITQYRWLVLASCSHVVYEHDDGHTRALCGELLQGRNHQVRGPQVADDWPTVPGVHAGRGGAEAVVQSVTLKSRRIIFKIPNKIPK